ncbi:Major capsid protein [Acetobacter pasteurianus subsp. pasteurianus]|uniref:Major capsid protein n=1 Tax=Acetobacter pasteurianus subsp. pasteurianus TaxID=481145 RepID=A0AAC9STM6_ACEPA|nr:phage major capsid protein [Acetobacter pasteurianus]ASC05626.1 Major capsid protein [Acetobacter pasteurianus subsp. pasteurianus]
MSELDTEYKAAIKDLSEATDEVKKFAETSKAELKNLGKVTDETKASADKALTALTEITARVTDLEQKSSRAGKPTEQQPQSIGQKFVMSDEVKAVMGRASNWMGTVQVEVKNITSASSTGTSGTTGLVVADRQPQIIQQPTRKLVIRDLLMPGQTSSAAIDYVKETGFTNNADFVAENPSTSYPQSDVAFTLESLPVRTVAHFMMASKQILADAPMLQSYIDGRLRIGLGLKEDDALLNGDGTGVTIKGLMAQSTKYAQPAGVTIKDESMIDRLRLAMLQTTLAEYPATGHILNPTDWASIELSKDAQLRYIFANPLGLTGPVLWGLPVAESLAMGVGKFMTGAFSLAAQIFDREDATVSISTEDGNNVRKGMVTIVGEERLALAVYRPEALINGDFTGIDTAAPTSGTTAGG